MSKPNPRANVPKQEPEEPLGDRGHGDKTWAPEPGEQGISNRIGDEGPGSESDLRKVGHDGKDLVSMAEDDTDEDDEFEDDGDEADDEEDEEDEPENSTS